MTKKTVGILLICTGILFLMAAGTMFFLHWQESQLAGVNSAMLLQEFSQSTVRQQESAMYDTAEEEHPAGQMPQVTLSGYDLVGVIRVPGAGIELPVQNSWSYELLKISPCRYSGSLEDGNLILLGHNYVTHFSALRRAKVGDTVEFCDASGTWHSFSVSATETLKATELEKLTATEHPLTVFTCTRDGVSRFVLRCDYAE